MNKYLYPTHPVRCIITGRSERDKLCIEQYFKNHLKSGTHSYYCETCDKNN